MRSKLLVVHVNGYKMKWWERLALALLPMEGWNGEYTVGSFKILFGKMYIYSIRHHTTMQEYDNSLGRFN